MDPELDFGLYCLWWLAFLGASWRLWSTLQQQRKQK